MKPEHSSWEVPYSKQHVGISHTPPPVSYLSHMDRFIAQQQRQKSGIPSRRDNVCYVQLQHVGRNELFFSPPTFFFFFFFFVAMLKISTDSHRVSLS